MTNEDGSARLRPSQAHLTLSALLLTLALLISWRAVLAAEPTKRFNLPAQDLSSALITFGHQSGVQTLFGYDESEDIDALRSRSVLGEFTVEEALTRLLQGTGLQFRRYAPGKIAVFRPKPSPTAPPAQPQSLKTDLGPTSQLASLNEIHVTGTRLRGALDVVAPTVIMPSHELRKSTFATVHDSLYSMPLNSLSGPREDVFMAGNLGLGAGINLRHLGAGATLVLVNGHRMPASGDEAAFTDVSNIPWSAVERIEIVPDGSSALYGSDAIGGVVNIVMRDDLDGAESQARLTSLLGGGDELQASQLFGKRWSSGRALLAYQYSERAPLAAADRAYAASTDKRPFGGTDYRSYDAGNVLDPITLEPVLGIPEGGVRTADDYSPLVNRLNLLEHWQLLPKREMQSVFLTATQALGERSSIRGEVRHGVRNSKFQTGGNRQIFPVLRSNPFFVDPFPDRASPYVLIAYNFVRDLGPATYDATTRVSTGAVSASTSLGRDWRVVLSHSYGEEALKITAKNGQNPFAVLAALNQTDPAKAFNPFGRTSPNVIAAIRQTYSLSALSKVAAATAIADGTLGLMAAGPVRVAMGAEYRRESFDAWRSGGGHPLHPDGMTQASQRYVGSAFVETSLPLLANPRDSRSPALFEFMAAGRFENYSDFGDTFNPRLSLQWAPDDEMKLRASWGRSFRAPTLVDRDTRRNVSSIVSLPDPKSPSARSAVLVLEGNNPDVREETATTWTVGADWVPAALEGLKLSLTYFDVDYGDRIIVPSRSTSLGILYEEDRWASIINRHPTREQVDAICGRKDFVGPEDCAHVQPAIIVDGRKMNFAETEMNGFDAHVERGGGIGSNFWSLHLTGTYLLEFTQRSSPAAPVVGLLKTVTNPPALKMRVIGEWSQHPASVSGLNAAAAINYTGGSRDVESVPVRKVRPWTTLDLQLRYRTSAAEGWLAGADVMLNAVNVFNTPPPFVDRATGYDVANAQPIGRTVSLEFRKSW